MATHIEYSQEKDLDEALAACLASNPKFIQITDHCKVVACYVIRTNDKEEEVPGKTEQVAIKKVPPAFQVFTKPKADFVLIVDHHFWENATEAAKKGRMTRALTRIGVENTDNGIKLSIRPWDIQNNITAIELSGVYDEDTSRAKEAFDRVRNTLAMTEAVLNRMAKPREEAPEPKPKAKGKGKTEDEAEPKLRPARKPPADPVPKDEPEPEPE